MNGKALYLTFKINTVPTPGALIAVIEFIHVKYAVTLRLGIVVLT